MSKVTHGICPVCQSRQLIVEILFPIKEFGDCNPDREESFYQLKPHKPFTRKTCKGSYLHPEFLIKEEGSK